MEFRRFSNWVYYMADGNYLRTHIFKVRFSGIRIRHRQSNVARLDWRRDRSAGPPGTPSGAQGLGGLVRQAQNDAPVADGQSSRTFAVSAFRLPEHQIVLP